MEKVNYKILQGESPKELESIVNEYLKKGYELQGGVCVSEKDGFCWQAVNFTITRI